MKRIKLAIASLALGFGVPASGAQASIVPAPELSAGGSLFLLNNVSGTVYFCFLIVNGAKSCAAVTTFTGVTVNTKMVASSGNLYIVEPSTGQTMVCYATLYVGKLVPTCTVLTAKLP